MAGGIVAEPLNPRDGFNWVFLVELLICGILTVFFFFYFNRLFATLISYAVRAYTWRNFHAYIDITGLQISPLGGRIFFKDIRYHGHNETILVHGGYITWNYWLRRVRDAAVYAGSDASADPDSRRASSASDAPSTSRSRNVDKAEKGGKQTPKQLPCRISVKISGVEAFMYNRSPAYDGIVDAFQRKAHANTEPSTEPCSSASHATRSSSVSQSDGSSHDEEHHHKKLRKDPPAQEENVQRVDTSRSTTSTSKRDNLPAFLRILPVHVDITKGAIVVGNENTLAVIMAQFEKATGTLDASSSGPLDVYQQLFSFQVTHPIVHMKPNPDYKSSQLDSAALYKQESDKGIPEESIIEKDVTHKHRKPWSKSISILSGLFSKSSDSVHTHSKSGLKNSKYFAPQWHFPGQERWKGLARYLDDSQNDGHGEWDGIEYAKTSLIADIPCVNVSFYWDVTGPVPAENDNSMFVDSDRPHDINGSVPPDYGMDIEVFGGLINYGPWADRHRGIFQNIFFPGARVDAVPAAPLQTGDPRTLSVFKLFLFIGEDTVLRIPIREPSKDWRWKGKAHTLAAHEKSAQDKAKGKSKSRKRRGKQRDTTAAQNVRPFAWIDVKVAGNSTVNYTMDMVASSKGFGNKLDVSIASTEISSSVNHGLLWRSGSIALDCDLSAPLAWNTLRTWMFNIKCQDLELFLLRDHLFLLTDLVADWGAGPPPDYFLFVPFRYLLHVDFNNFKLYLNTNDSNIVNNPADLDDNDFIILSGEHLQGDVTIPLDKFRPLQNEIQFDVRGDDMTLEVLMPPKNTLKTFLRSPKAAKLGGLTLKGSHTYVTTMDPMNTDRLFMDIQGHRLNLELYGWLIHHFMKIKENYFGDDMHFKTLEEFQGLPSTSLSKDEPGTDSQPVKISNDLDVILCISVDDTSVLVPANLYSAERSVRADLPYASADLRFTNYYMDLMVNFSPISVSLSEPTTSPESSPEQLHGSSSGQTELFVDSVVIFGHRLFGLPPTEPTYICNWDFDVGKISGECTSAFIETAAGAARSFAFTLDDDENSVPLTEIPIIHDTTLLRLRTQDVHIWLHIAPEALLVKTSAITLDFNDLAGATFSQRLSACVPDLTVGAVDARSASRHRTRSGGKRVVETHAFFQTTLSLNMLTRKLDFRADRDKQQAHMREHDQRTNRASFLFKREFDHTFYQPTTVQNNVRPPAMQFPDMPQPILFYGPRTHETASLRSTASLSNGSLPRGRRSGTGSLRSTSNGSLASSIRSTIRHKHTANTTRSSRSRTLFGGSSNRAESGSRFHTPLGEDERTRRNLAPSSVALSSSLAPPYFPLDQIDPDLSDVPSIPNLPTPFEKDRDDALVFNDVSTGHLDETFAHTSLLISAEPGIRIYCTPDFVKCISNLVEIIQPLRPEDLLDDFQIKVMTRILDNRTRLEGIGSSLEFNVRVPFAHIRFQHGFDSTSTSAAGKDQYDVIANNLELAARMKKFPGERAGEDSLALHTTLGSLGLSVTERALQGPSEGVAVQAELRDVLVWSLQNKESSVNISFRSFETAAASKKIEYLAALVHRTTLLAEELALGFVEADEQQQRRLRYLAWYLTSVQDQYADPAFLIKVSYALRAARDHLRSHDSWKIISRFRYTWQCLPSYEKRDLTRKCAQRSVGCPENAEEMIITMWDQWRTWDLAHVKKSLAMRLLFCHLAESLPTPESAPLCVAVKSAGIKLIVDPGPKQSEIELVILAINVVLLPPVREPDALGVVTDEIPTKSSTVQVSSRETLFQVNWEICELAEALTNLFLKEDDAPRTTVMAKSPPPKHAKTPVYHQDVQVVFVTDRSQIILDTINLRSVMTGRHLRFSFIDADKKASGRGEILSAHMHLELAVGEIFSRSRSLAKAQFEQPSLYFALVEHEKGSNIPDEIKTAAASQMIIFKIQEDISGFVEVVDAVLREEVAYFQRQSKAIQSIAKKEKEKKTSETVSTTSKVKDAQLPNVTLALFMDAYQVELALLQPLGWSISGKSGRIAVVPALGKNVTLRVDYDLDASHHRLYSTSSEGSHVISSLQLPAVNGRLNVSQTDQETRIMASGIIETIQIQAREIQALATTLNKPEITQMLDAVREDVEVLKTHIEEIFPPDEDSAAIRPPIPLRDVLFGVQLTFSGMNVVAIAPGKDDDSPTANLAFCLSSVQLEATNISTDDKAMLFPEAIVRIHEVTIDMTLTDAKSIRRCGNLTFSAIFQATTEHDSEPQRRLYRVRSSGLQLNVFADTASAVVDVMNHLQDRIKDLDLSKEKQYFRRLRHTKSKLSSKRTKSVKSRADTDDDSIDSGALFTSTYSMELLDLQATWVVGTSIAPFPNTETEDLVLSFKRINLSTQKDDAARLMIEDMQLQMVPVSADKKMRSLNSALLPRMQFNVAYASTKETRKLAFHAAGKALDLQLDSHFILPANVIERSIALAGKNFRKASANWSVTPTTSGAQRKNPFGNKRLSSLTVDANFAGAVVHINGREGPPAQGTSHRSQQKGRYSQFVGDGSKSSMVLRAPGIALRVEYQDEGQDPSLTAELRVDGSSNTLLPTVVPIIIDISDSIKAVVRDKDGGETLRTPQEEKPEPPAKPSTKLVDEDSNIINADPSALLGRTSLNLGLRICKQEFSLSCQPIARVAAIAKLEDIYVTVNSVKSQEHGHFFAASATFTKLNATVQHVYSRESTFGLDMESIVLSLMNSKHLSGTSGISAILKISPTALQINARQLHDFLLFREIWIPPEIRQSSQPADSNVNPNPEPQEYLMQRYQQVTAATAFPWNANVAIADIRVDLDLGQAIGKSSLHIHNMWASSTKGTDWEQNLCIGVEKVSLESTGRTSGFVELAGLKVRTSIRWPSRAPDKRSTPLIQASIAFGKLHVKSGFDYQAFAIADIANFEFLMYNVRDEGQGAQDRLVAILDGDKVHVYCHATSAAQGLALYQAIERLVQENQQAYLQSLKDIEKYLRRKSSVSQPFARSPSPSTIAPKPNDDSFKAPISLHTDVVVTLRSINLGVYPGTFLDNVVLMLEAGDMQARFAVALETPKIHSSLSMTLGQLSVAFSSIPSPKKSKPVADLTVEDVVESARSARGGTILRVPRVIATMHTWQAPKNNHIDYVFKSSLEGKVDVGWNYSRISHIRQMWTNHSRTLAGRLGKPLPESNIKISTSQPLEVPPNYGQHDTETTANTTANEAATRTRALSVSTGPNPNNPDSEQEKITAVVNVPQSKYEYTPLEPSIIETPQLRDMGEATPPLEWIGLHRDRLPNVTHQIVIVTLLEVAREVEDAYERILGSS
ncbi:fermentation [Ascochyta rabiei]|uniref:Fermentation n=1 Tax=Didymella rabiei TaxID=5454 RepID=A0A163CVC4_DIDRA|nr:fermentation [Ascochyta rabiei]